MSGEPALRALKQDCSFQGISLIATKTLQSAILAHTFLVTVLVGSVAAVTHEKNSVIPLVVIGVMGSVISILWHWRQRPYATEIRAILSAETVLLYIILIPCGLFVLLIGSWILYALYAQTRVPPCICPGQAGGSSLLNIVIGSAAVTLFGIVGLFSLCLCMGALLGFREKNS
jgi:hypothetical protein